MTIGTITFDEIEERHLVALRENGVAESRDIDFKRDPIGRDDASKKEFLKDVSALVNTAGGDIIIGIEETDGVAGILHGIVSPPADAEILRLESILQDGLEPRMVGVRIRSVQLAAGGYVLIIRVQASWNPPHRVVFQKWNKFFARNSGGVYELSVEQLRHTFLGGAELERRLTNFRVERIARLKSGVGTRLDTQSGQLVVHIVPVQAGNPINIPAIAASSGTDFGPFLTGSGHSSQPNFDGLLITSGEPDSTGRYPQVTQIFRNGTLEAATASMFFDRDHQGRSVRFLSYGPSIHSLVAAIPRYTRALDTRGVSPPFAMMVSLLGVNGSIMAFESQYPRHGGHVDRDDLLFDPIILDSIEFKEGWQVILKPLFDAWWNAYGYQRCFNLYDTDGKWAPKRW